MNTKLNTTKKGDFKPILLWKYWKNWENFEEKKIKKAFNLADDHHNETENFSSILEHEEENAIIEDGCMIWASCFANRYIREDTNNSYRFDKCETAAYGTNVHYP